MCVADTKYGVVRHVGKKIKKWRLTAKYEIEWDVY